MGVRKSGAEIVELGLSQIEKVRERARGERESSIGEYEGGGEDRGTEWCERGLCVSKI